MAQFPDEIFSGRALENAPGITYDATKVSRLYAEDLNNATAEITAIETVLGVDPQGAFDTVDLRIAALEAGGGGGGGGTIREPLTNGDVDSPELLFSGGDIILA